MNSNGNKSAPTTATQRLKQDYLRIKKDPVPYICAEPLPSNILEWHYVVWGPEKTPYEGGYYHGKLVFPQQFPFKPPSIYMITPNGRFKCNTRLCLSITDFHPDTWNPAWSVSTILIGLLSFMVEKSPMLGSIKTSDYTKRQLSAQSLAFNLKDRIFCELFPDVVEEIKQKQKAQEELSSRPQALPLPDVVPDGEQGHFGPPEMNGHVPLGEAAAPQHLALQQDNRNHGLLGGALANLFNDVPCDDSKVEFNVDAPNGIVMEGYLFKRSTNAFKTWNRRWFSIQNSQLVYQKKLKDALTVVVEDLRLCSVKPCEDIERRFCFVVVSLTKSCMLQAESEKLCQAWIQAVQASIASAYREITDNYYIECMDRTASPSTSSIDSASEPRQRSMRGESILQRVLSLPGNEVCCDCGRAEPRWAYISQGILLCIECSGIHRSLGVRCSKVRSLTLDCWEPELMKLMCDLGNMVINHIYEGACEERGMKKPGPNSSRQEKEAWIKAKYVERKFLKKMCGLEALVEGGRKSHHWHVKKCRRNNSTIGAPKTRHKYRQGGGSVSPATLSAAAAAAKFRRESLFSPDELDSLFSYFDIGSGPRKCEDSEESSGEVEVEQETSDLEDVQEPHPSMLLYKASQARNLPVMAEALAHGADVNSINEEDEGKSPLIHAVTGGSLIACEFLLQNGADVNQKDVRRRGPLHHATSLGHTGQVCLFLKRGASHTEVDEDGQDPLSIAVQAANADIVTLLRLARKEMHKVDGPLGQPDASIPQSPQRVKQKERISPRSVRSLGSFRTWLHTNQKM